VKPSVVLCDHAPTALLASRFFNVRRAMIGTGFFSPPDETPLRDLAPWMPPNPASDDTAKERALLDRINRILMNGSRPPLERVTQLYSEADANFLLTLPELDHYGHRSEGDYRGMWSPRGGVVPEWPTGDGPRLFAYLMPSQDIWQPASLLQAIEALGNPAVVYAPSCDQRLLEKVVAPNIRIQRERCDMDSVAQQASVAIGHGNNGTTTRFLLGGVPQLLMPLNLEQFILSRRVVATGAGLMVRPESPEHITRYLYKILHDSRFKTAAATFAAKYEAFDGHASATSIVDELESLASAASSSRC